MVPGGYMKIEYSPHRSDDSAQATAHTPSTSGPIAPVTPRNSTRSVAPTQFVGGNAPRTITIAGVPASFAKTVWLVPGIDVNTSE